MRAFAIALLLLTAAGCKKDQQPELIIDPVIEKIALKGTFQRNTTVEGPKVPVELEVGANGGYRNKGAAYANRYPVIGYGRFESGVDFINFIDSSHYTADFDWSLILQGKYQASREGDSIVLTKVYGTQQKDIYKLKMVAAN
ncbi:hypothetical protein [Paraflavitalea pollutisoli]|uniref:hypothetical protein n=1 Tax=Paraflavitalea pollutisoli TaxID=3034143 RepID=UPI0023EE0BA8|nr:hypothetical protein [Paraflavitalea sp. H1-2-19X]